MTAIARYHDHSSDALQVIQELLKLARDWREEPEDGLSQEAAAFYDALTRSESAVALMGNEDLRIIAAELVNVVHASASVDWWRKDNVRTKIRVAVKRILKKHGFPPDLQVEAIKHVVQQAEAMARELSWLSVAAPTRRSGPMACCSADSLDREFRPSARMSAASRKRSFGRSAAKVGRSSLRPRHVSASVFHT